MALSSSSSSSSAVITATDIFPGLFNSQSSVIAFRFPIKPRNNTHFSKLSIPTGPDKWRTRVSFFPSFLKKGKDATTLKEELFEAIAPLDRGADATPDDQERIDQLARKLEAANPTKEPLKSNLLNGKWELIYTTSSSILQTQRPKFLRSSANYQAINSDTLRAQNMESRPFFNQVTADLTPLNARKVAVKFDTFKIAGLVDGKSAEVQCGRNERSNFLFIAGLHNHLLQFKIDQHMYWVLVEILSFMVVAVTEAVDGDMEDELFSYAPTLPIKAPGRARGELEITYLDEELRVSRGDKGNLFVLKMVDPSYRIPT
ncbi:hypothetical protein HHK36_032981 [Tetracentron sinense]|uniref:Plastid lipid-associated protein/fibrillin conserved domain-containing protein n=1 Tax=Tetracentron sinense TaxID=13715 RepID=A0A834Y9E7_TETSI|nr:hypothetical protein HHK36_032981 [Tetracentron sinense]